ncbi:flagellar hook-length control protein FliK [Massilia scottii]|uniref:flagellar hook-length control protein FliK n=1 Tax=Massilia scottii TaxID=3057166 RepID=UPI00279670F2|nr:flagellar hook-length control protein FliK [Massilia sp. CCM 9029]MDQ1832904.1 flagellar hook-length control protein FliK [Massilia sp. CCM 9029]
MMLANLPPSPAAQGAPGATGAAAPAAAVPAPAGGDAAAPFASWLMFDIAAVQVSVPEGEAGSAEAAPADGLAEPGVLPDSAAPAVSVDTPDDATTPAMTMSMTLPLGIVLPPAVPMPSSMPATLAAPVAGAAPAAGASAPVSFASPLTPAAAPTPAMPAAPAIAVAAAVPAAPASTVSSTFSAPPAATSSAGATDSATDRGAADARSPAAAPVALPAAAPVALPAQAQAAAPAPRAPLRTGESTTPGSAAAPAAQKTGVAATAQPLAAATVDTVLRSDAPLAGPANVMNGANALASQGAAMAAPLEVKLPANPADWQQPLREALGERLQLQLGRNIDQAVIRLDPPQLGRIEIAIRHAAGGALEVNISATHSEVRRQLNSVSDAMRSDLAQRQFSDVAVTITATPRSGAAFGEQQGRQRQPDRDNNDNDPGRALAEAGHPSATFSLSGREYAA